MASIYETFKNQEEQIINKEREKIAKIVYFIFSWLLIKKIIIDNNEVTVEVNFWNWIKFHIYFLHKRVVKETLKQLELEFKIRF